MTTAYAAYIRRYDESTGGHEPKTCRELVHIGRNRTAVAAQARATARSMAKEVWAAPGQTRMAEPLIEIEEVSDQRYHEIREGAIGLQ